MALHSRILPVGLDCGALPSSAQRPLSSELWLHEIKHDGFRVIARGNRVKLYSRPGNELTKHFPLIAQPSRKVLIEVLER
jgi:ATP-dependent DNA ligase